MRTNDTLHWYEAIRARTAACGGLDGGWRAAAPLCCLRAACRFVMLLALCDALPLQAHAAKIALSDGRILEGKVQEVGGVAEDPNNPKPPVGEVAVTPILLIDDGLRRTYVHKHHVRELLDPAAPAPVRIHLWQNAAELGRKIVSVGPALNVTPFDQFGRRIYEMQGAEGTIAVVQGITQVTPTFTRVKALGVEKFAYVWDMRLATSSIPKDTLHSILRQSVAAGDVEGRMQIVRLYLQSERYRDARLELESIIEENPDLPDLAELQAMVRQLRQLGSRSLLAELQLRASAGQHALVRGMLEQFPSEEVAGETLLQVREMLRDYEQRESRRMHAIEVLRSHAGQLPPGAQRQFAEQFLTEISAQLNDDTLDRFTSFLRLADDPGLEPQEKLALAVSGWLLGANDATDNFSASLSMAEVRTRVIEYLREPLPARRAEILTNLRDLEGATVPRIAQMLKYMAPPVPIPAEARQGEGYYELSVPALTGDARVRYFVQLPPEYSPLRHYPTIVTLSGEGYDPRVQLDYWAGPQDAEKKRGGQAMRHGYITIAVEWLTPGQVDYQYSAQEHHAVLASLRDASRRFAIDSDRVFLTGHGIGGDAAWDLALAHPDLWAGVMPIVAVADRYCKRYWENGAFVPWYFVCGEMDGDKIFRNSSEYDRYLRPSFDATIVEYLGRGFEPYGDEIQRLFEWMGRRRRELPEQFDCSTMRPWDNYFWWLEVHDINEQSTVLPEAWPPTRGVRPMLVKGRSNPAQNQLSVPGSPGRATVWLGPEWVSFDKPITVEFNGRRATSRIDPVLPQLEVLLEDVRTRGDRLHPYWAKVERP